MLVALPVTAFAAGHMRPGLWSISSTMSMPSMPKIPPEALARMKAMHIKMPMAGEPIVMQECITPAQAAMDRPPRMGRNDTGCSAPNVKFSGSGMTSEVVCNGEMKGTGIAHIEFGGREHYAGTYHFDGTSHGRAVNMSVAFKGDFAGADCGAVKPLPY